VSGTQRLGHSGPDILFSITWQFCKLFSLSLVLVVEHFLCFFTISRNLGMFIFVIPVSSMTQDIAGHVLKMIFCSTTTKNPRIHFNSRIFGKK